MKTPIYADLDQIVFEGRSQDYGAYQMRQRYNRILTRAMLIAFLLFISITGLPKVISWISPVVYEEVCLDENPPLEDWTEVELEDKVDEPEVPAIPLPPQPPMATVAVSIPTPTPKEDLEQEVIIAAIADLDSAAVGLVTVEGPTGEEYPWTEIEKKGKCPTCPPTETEVPEEEISSTTFVLLEKEPQAVNMDELRKLIGYPAMAIEAQIEGKVILRIQIDKNGDYVKHIVVKEPHPILTRAVTEKISHLKMTPGIQAGKPIKVWVTLPFDFHLLK